MSKWNGSKPIRCDICGKAFGRTEGTDNMEVFIDGATKQGPWGLLCIGCHERHGHGLGTGRGQMYNLKSLEKVGG